MPPLSEAAELEILHATAEHFWTIPAHDDLPDDINFDIVEYEVPPHVVSMVYKENGHYHSRIVHKGNTEHL